MTTDRGGGGGWILAMCTCHRSTRAAVASILARLSGRSSRTNQLAFDSPICARSRDPCRKCGIARRKRCATAQRTMSARTRSAIVRRRVHRGRRAADQVDAARIPSALRLRRLADRCLHRCCVRRRRLWSHRTRCLRLALERAARVADCSARRALPTPGSSERSFSVPTSATAIGTRQKRSHRARRDDQSRVLESSRQVIPIGGRATSLELELPGASDQVFRSQTTALNRQRGGIPVFLSLEPCRRDLSRCPERARQCAMCPRREDGRSGILSQGLTMIRSLVRRRRHNLGDLLPLSRSQRNQLSRSLAPLVGWVIRWLLRVR